MHASAPAPDHLADEVAGPAHVATVSFLASRAVPSGGFWVALAGGTAMARVAQRRSAREGYGASVAAMLETVAIMGPARFGVPLTQAVTAPMLGRLEARSIGALLQVLACGAFRVVINGVGAAFFIWVIAGGLDAYAGTYEALAERFGLVVGERETLVLTLAGLLAWGGFASAVQVWVYRRGLRAWSDEPRGEGAQPADVSPHDGRFDPRAVAVSAGLAFALLLASTEWPLLAVVAAWLAAAWLLSRADRAAVPTGIALAALLAGGAFAFTLGGGLGLDLALRRAARAALLVLVATWLRAAAGAGGLREVARRGLAKVRHVPAAPEAARVLDRIGSEGRLMAAGRALADSLKAVERRPLPLLDAVLGWVSREAARFAVGPRPVRPVLRVGFVDGVLVVSALAPATALVI